MSRSEVFASSVGSRARAYGDGLGSLALSRFWKFGRNKRLMTQLAQAANDDTPANVQVPATPMGVATWALRAWGPWGAILIFTVILWMAYTNSIERNNDTQKQMIQELKAQNESLRMTIFMLENTIVKEKKT